MSEPIVVGLDLSLTGAGLAVVSRDPAVGVHTTVRGSKTCGDEIAPRADRLVNLTADLIGIITALPRPPALVVVERPTFGRAGGAVTDRAGLWWLVCSRIARGLQLPIVDVVNNHLKMYATGSGGGAAASKDAVLAETVRRYQHVAPTLADNNEADALQLAALGLDRLTGYPLVELPQTHRRAVTAVKWPANVPNGTL